jgi:uncharacterized protein
MFYVKIRLEKSKIHGIGLFTGENISKNQKIYAANEKLDLLLSEKEFSKLSLDEQNTIKNYGYFDKNNSKWYLGFDNIRFCNHSLNGNLILKERTLIAKRDISEGEELTQNYTEFENLRKELD